MLKPLGDAGLDHSPSLSCWYCGPRVVPNWGNYGYVDCVPSADPVQICFLRARSSVREQQNVRLAVPLGQVEGGSANAYRSLRCADLVSLFVACSARKRTDPETIRSDTAFAVPLRPVT